jgi:hypothetical protein
MKARLPYRGRHFYGLLALAAAIALTLPATASATFTPLGTWSTTFHSPDAIAIVPSSTGAAQDVWITEDTGDTPGQDAEEFTPTGTLVQQIGPTFSCPASTSGSFDYPDGIAVDPATDDVFVDDSGSGNQNVFEFNSSGTFIAEIGGGAVSTTCGAADGTGTAPGDFGYPAGLSVADGQLFVAEPGANPGATGANNYVDEIPVPLRESDMRTTELALSGDYGQAVYDPGTGDVYAADSALNNFDVYTPGGTLIEQWGPLFGNDTEFGSGSPQWAAIDPSSGILYASDIGSCCSGSLSAIYTFDAATGAYEQTLNLPDGTDPEGVAVDPVNHILYIVEDGSVDTVARYSYTPAPTCAPSSTVTSTNTPVTPALSCSDQAGSPVTYAIVSQPAHGTLSAFNPSTGAATYTPDSGYAGTDSFTYNSSSINGTSQPSTVSIVVGPPPACAPETLATSSASALTVTLACSGNAQTPSGYQIVSGPAHGSLSTPSSGGTLTYTPTAGYSGSDSFTYEGLSSSGVASVPETVTIYVATALPPPVEHQSANLLYASGTVFITLPGQTQPIPLVAGMQVPLGSIVNATAGRVELLVTNQAGEQHADFYNGEFSVNQSTNTHAPATTLAKRFGLGDLLLPARAAKAATVYAVLDLLGAPLSKPACTTNPRSIAGTFSLTARIAKAKAKAKAFRDKHKVVRQLWGSGHGDFTTVGNGSASSVRGTRWAIFDYPDGTLTRVYTDSVSVYDFYTHRTRIVKSGHFYFAALGNLKRCS